MQLEMTFWKKEFYLSLHISVSITVIPVQGLGLRENYTLI